MSFSWLTELPQPDGLEAFPLDDDGRPVKNFGGERGWEYEPICPTYYAHGWLDMLARSGDETLWDGILHMADLTSASLRPVSSNSSALALWHDAPIPPVFFEPWWCCMTTGRALEMFVRIHSKTGDKKWFQLAKRCAAALLLPLEQGGTAISLWPGSIFYEEAVDAVPRLRVLNAHGSTLFSLYYWAQATGDQQAWDLLMQGCEGFARTMPDFDGPDGQGSLIRQQAPGWLRLRAQGRNGREPEVKLRSLKLAFPDDRPMIIDFANERGRGWELTYGPSSVPVVPELHHGHLVRRLGPCKVMSSNGKQKLTWQMRYKIGLTLWKAQSNYLLISGTAWMKKGDTLFIDLHPDRYGKYTTVCKYQAQKDGWQGIDAECPMQELGTPAKVGGPDHHYHFLNASYAQFVYWLRPDMPYADIARRWIEQSSTNNPASHDGNQLFWWSKNAVERRWNPNLDGTTLNGFEGI